MTPWLFRKGWGRCVYGLQRGLAVQLRSYRCRRHHHAQAVTPRTTGLLPPPPPHAHPCASPARKWWLSPAACPVCSLPCPHTLPCAISLSLLCPPRQAHPPPPALPIRSCRDDGSGLQPLDDCWALDTSAQPLTWRQVSIQGDVPAARNAAVAGVVGHRVVYHGGWRPFQRTFNDTFELEVTPATQ